EPERDDRDDDPQPHEVGQELVDRVQTLLCGHRTPPSCWWLRPEAIVPQVRGKGQNARKRLYFSIMLTVFCITPQDNHYEPNRFHPARPRRRYLPLPAARRPDLDAAKE